MATPLVVEDKVEAFLGAHGLGEGPITARRIGDGGGSNFTFMVERGGERYDAVTVTEMLFARLDALPATIT